MLFFAPPTSKFRQKKQKCKKKHEIIFQKKMQKKAEMQKERCKKKEGGCM